MEHEPTPSQTVGPYLHIGMTDRRSVTRMAGPEITGVHIRLKCRVLDVDNAPVNDAMIEIWQADGNGSYNHPDDPKGTPAGAAFRGFGRAATDEKGACAFDTIRPGRVPGTGNAMQAPHLNVAVYARGVLLQIYTRIYFADDPANDSDPVLAMVPPDRRGTLIANPDAHEPGSWIFDIHLRGNKETAFFDV